MDHHIYVDESGVLNAWMEPICQFHDGWVYGKHSIVNGSFICKHGGKTQFKLQQNDDNEGGTDSCLERGACEIADQCHRLLFA